MWNHWPLTSRAILIFQKACCIIDGLHKYKRKFDSSFFFQLDIMTSIKDPAGVSALLARLRESQAWSNIQTNAKASSETRQIRRQAEPPAQTQSVPSVADLLSQLSSPSAVPSTITSPNSTTSCSTDLSTSIQHGTSGSLTLQRSSSSRDNRNTQDVRALSFQQALPHIARLSEDPSFNKNINEVRVFHLDLDALWQYKLLTC